MAYLSSTILDAGTNRCVGYWSVCPKSTNIESVWTSECIGACKVTTHFQLCTLGRYRFQVRRLNILKAMGVIREVKAKISEEGQHVSQHQSVSAKEDLIHDPFRLLTFKFFHRCQQCRLLTRICLSLVAPMNLAVEVTPDTTSWGNTDDDAVTTWYRPLEIQYSLWHFDPKQRVKAFSPEIQHHDLREPESIESFSKDTWLTAAAVWFGQRLDMYCRPNSVQDEVEDYIEPVLVEQIDPHCSQAYSIEDLCHLRTYLEAVAPRLHHISNLQHRLAVAKMRKFGLTYNLLRVYDEICPETIVSLIQAYKMILNEQHVVLAYMHREQLQHRLDAEQESRSVFPL